MQIPKWILLVLVTTHLAATSNGSKPYDASWPEAKRQAYFQSFFKPSPGHPVTLEEKPVLGDKARSLDPFHFSGFIEVSPPQGVCFIVTRKESSEDSRVCSKSVLSFSAQDFDAGGNLHWTVAREGKDFATELIWPTSYRYVRVVDESMPWPGASRYMILKSCTAIHSHQMGRRLELGFVGNIHWVVSFPDQDLLGPQPSTEKPNLFVQTSTFSSGFIKIETAEEKAERVSAENSRFQQIGRKFAATKETLDESDPNEIKAPWQMHPRDAYQMDGSFFKGESSPPPLMNSSCRYKFHSADTGNEGEFECHNVSEYKWIYARLPCLGELEIK